MWPYFQKTAETPLKKWKRISWQNSVAHGQYCLTLLSLSKSWVSSKIFKDVFLTLSSIYDRVFLQKQLKAFDRKLFSQNSSILDIWKGSRYNFNFQDDYKWLRQKRHYNIHCFDTDLSIWKIVIFPDLSMAQENVRKNC